MIDIKELRQHEFLMFCYEHYNGLGLARSLGINGIRPVVFLLNRPGKVIRASRYPKRIILVDNYEQALEIAIKEYGNAEKKAFLLPVDDDSIWLIDSRYDELKQSFIIPGAGQSHRLGGFMDKLSLCRTAEKCGIPYAETWVVNPSCVASTREGGEFNSFHFPVITKPLTSYPGWKADYRVCANEEELRAALKTISHPNDDLLIQRYIKKKNELCLDGFSANGGKDVFVAIQSLYTYTLPDYYSMEMIVSKFENAELMEKIKKMFATIGYEGIFSMEFLIDETGSLYFLEINFRNSTWSWACTKLGMNLPLLWASAMLEGGIKDDPSKPIPEGYIALAEIQDYEHRVQRLHLISKWRWLKGFFRAKCRFTYYWRDPWPFYRWLLGSVKNKLFPRKKRRDA